jgi:hypothetical protein
MEKAQEPILSTDCARLPDLSFVAPLQMEMGTVSTDAAAGANYGLDKGPLPCAGEGGCARSGHVTLMELEHTRFGQATADRGRFITSGKGA